MLKTKCFKKFIFLIFILIILSSSLKFIKISHAEIITNSEKWIDRYTYEIKNNDKNASIFYLSPQVYWDYKTNDWKSLNFENHYSENSFYFLQNAHVAIEIYDYYVKYYDPDYQTISVYDERFEVQRWNPKVKGKWEDIGAQSGTPKFMIIQNETYIKLTKTFTSWAGILNISYILKPAQPLKHEITWKSSIIETTEYRVLMKISGIVHNKVKTHDEEFIITKKEHKVTPFFSIGENEDSLIFTESLLSLGYIDDNGTWISDILKDVIFDTHAKGSKVDIIIGNYTLKVNEVLFIDPDTSTFEAQSITYFIYRRASYHPPDEGEYGQSKDSGSSVIWLGQKWSTNAITKYVDGNGTIIEWDSQFPASGEHYDKLSSNDGDTTYIASTTVGDRDLFTMQNLTDEGYEYKGVDVVALIKEVGGTGTVRIIIKTHGTIYEGDIETLSTSYSSEVHSWEVNPFTSADWTLQELNDVEIGIKVETCAGEIRATQIYTSTRYKMYYVYRSYISFDTSSIDDGVTILDADLSLAVKYDTSLSVDFDIKIYSGVNQWTGIGDINWDDCSIYEGIWRNTAGMSTNTYYNMTILTSSISKTSTTQFRGITSREAVESLQYEFLRFWGYSSGTYKPRLYVEWGIPNFVPVNDDASIIDMDDTNNIYAQISGGYTIDYDGHDGNGYAEITYILVNLTQATTVRASFKYNEDTDTFSLINGTTGFGIVLGSCSATKSGNNINLTIAFVVKFGAIEENDLELKGYITDGIDEAIDTLQSNYVDVITNLVTTFSIDDDRGDISQPIIASGLITYSGSALYPPDVEFNNVSVYDSSNNNEGTDNTIVNGAWIISFNAPNIVGTDTYNLYIDMVDNDYTDGEEPTSDIFITDRYIVVFLSVNNTNPDVNETVLILSQVESEYDSHVLGYADELIYKDKDEIEYTMSYNGTYWNTTRSENVDITRIIDNYESMTEANYGITGLNMDGYLLVIAWGEGGVEGVSVVGEYNLLGWFIIFPPLILFIALIYRRRGRR